jgi:hypothetical protein
MTTSEYKEIVDHYKKLINIDRIITNGVPNTCYTTNGGRDNMFVIVFEENSFKITLDNHLFEYINLTRNDDTIKCELLNIIKPTKKEIVKLYLQKLFTIYKKL